MGTMASVEQSACLEQVGVAADLQLPCVQEMGACAEASEA